MTGDIEFLVECLPRKEEALGLVSGLHKQYYGTCLQSQHQKGEYRRTIILKVFLIYVKYGVYLGYMRLCLKKGKKQGRRKGGNSILFLVEGKGHSRVLIN